MINENGAYMERMAGKNPALEFCDRRDPRFERFVCEQVDGINRTRMFRDQKAENLGKELIDRIKRGQKDNVTMQEAQELLKVEELEAGWKEEIAKRKAQTL